MALPAHQGKSNSFPSWDVATPGTAQIKTLSTSSQASNVFDASAETLVHVSCAAPIFIQVAASPTATRTTCMRVAEGPGITIRVPANQKIAVISESAAYAGSDIVTMTPWG